MAVKIKDYFIYIRDEVKWLKFVGEVCTKFNLKHQYAFRHPTGAVTAMYSPKEFEKLYPGRHYTHETKSIISIVSIYEQQQEALDYIWAQRNKHKQTYSFIDDKVADELYRSFPKLKEAKKKWDWGDDMFLYYEAGFSYEYPQERVVDVDLLELRCDICWEDFEVVSSTEDIDGETVQCPHCKVSLKVRMELEPAFYTEVVE